MVYKNYNFFVKINLLFKKIYLMYRIFDVNILIVLLIVLLFLHNTLYI